MLKTKILNEIKDLINNHENIILFHHINPDGDTIATSFGFAEVLKENFPNKILHEDLSE